MPNGKSSGTFKANFKTERSFEVFGRQYARCYANLDVRGTMSAPRPTGGMEYEIGFNLDCGCDTVLKNFKVAYDKTFESNVSFPREAFGDFVITTEQQLAINDKDFTAELVSCGLHYDVTNPTEHFSRADEFFEDESIDGLDDDNNNYIDKDGLVQFIVAKELSNDPAVNKEVVRLSDTNIALSSIVNAYVNTLANTNNDPAIKKDPMVWWNAMNHLPLMGPSKIEGKTFKRQIKGIEVATDFINFILDAVSSQGDALKSFQQYLEKQGEAIKIGTEQNKDTYNTITLSVVTEAMTVGEEIVYLPKLKMYYVAFSRENFTFSGVCASYKEVKIDFEYQEVTTLFDYKALEVPSVKEAFEKFVNGKRKKQIEDADTFFGGDFGIED